MIPNDHVIMIYKFGEQRWISKVAQGELSFAAPGSFIRQAELTENKIQGDALEAVFAHIPNNDSRLKEMQDLLGNQLEIINDGDFVFLRRRHAKYIPTFCFYSYTAGDALRDGNHIHTGFQKLHFEFDERMYYGFSCEELKNVVNLNRRFSLMFIQPQEFVNRIKIALGAQSLSYKMDRVKYIDMHKEFFVEPTDTYDELFYKSDVYSYQCEGRICLHNIPFSNIYERYPLKICKFNVGKDCHIVDMKIHVEYCANIQKITSL